MSALVRKAHNPYSRTRAFSVIGDEGVVTLAWLFDPKGKVRGITGDTFTWDGDYFASDLGLHHKHKPDGDWYTRNSACEYTGGECWYDGSSLWAIDLGRIYVTKGEDALFDELEAIYASRFTEEK